MPLFCSRNSNFRISTRIVAKIKQRPNPSHEHPFGHFHRKKDGRVSPKEPAVSCTIALVDNKMGTVPAISLPPTKSATPRYVPNASKNFDTQQFAPGSWDSSVLFDVGRCFGAMPGFIYSGSTLSHGHPVHHDSASTWGKSGRYFENDFP